MRCGCRGSDQPGGSDVQCQRRVRGLGGPIVDVDILRGMIIE